MWPEAVIAGQFEVLGADVALLQSLDLAVHWFPSKVQMGSGGQIVCLPTNSQIGELHKFQQGLEVEN